MLNARLQGLSSEKGSSSDVSTREFKELVDLVHRIKEINENFKEESEAELKQVRTSVHDNLMKGK